MTYSWNGNATYFKASVRAYGVMARYHVQTHGVISADEGPLAGGRVKFPPSELLGLDTQKYC